LIEFGGAVTQTWCCNGGNDIHKWAFLIFSFVESSQVYVRDSRDLGIAPFLETGQGTEIVMLNCLGTFPSGNHEPALEHLARWLVCAGFDLFTARMADEISLRHNPPAFAPIPAWKIAR